MKISLKLIFTLLLAILFLVGASVLLSRYFEQYTSEFIDHDIYSEYLSEERRVFVRLPKGYDSQKSYPLIIKSDGNFNLSRWHETVATQSEKKLIEDSIIVAIPNLFWVDTRNRDLVPPYARKDVQIEARPSTENSPEIFGKADLFLSFIEKELIPFIENEYSINDNRVLSGFSAGGSFVLYTIVTKPELFTGYFAFSPAAWYDKSVVVSEFKNGLNKVAGKPLFLYLSLGGAENEIITGSFKGLLSAIDSNAPKNFHSVHSYSEGAGHVDNPFISVPLALEAYYKFRADKI
ncbi:esterase [Pseudoalteromonas sp. A25]|uniref:alpha/beta hydrolase n=1 Tax=Pseudoalteromonas sp. A25 TaxID=116092 RepID=UPI0012A1CE75|nr:alpha/beta hydrolase-fold protein [Pseudoalteromonas sp. A25]BBN81480.1 esterase [Pseudoalteromonas sp. A25]